MNENRRKILQMLATGQITADEAEQLIAALEKDQRAALPGGDSGAGPRVTPKYLRVVVEADHGKAGDRLSTVNIRVPMQLLRAGVRLASLIPASARERVNDVLRKDGVPFDLNQIKPENLDEMIYQLNEVTIDAARNNKKAKVMLFCE